MWVAEDDFPIIYGVLECLKFLRNHSDYSCARGLYGSYFLRKNIMNKITKIKFSFIEWFE